MKRIFILFGIVVFSAANVFAQTQAYILESLAMPSTILGQDIKYSVVLPVEYYAGKQSYPVVYLLHGLGDNESSWLEYGRISQAAGEAVKRHEIVPMIFVMPQGFRNYYVNDYAGKFLYEDMFIKELVPFIDNQYRTIADKEHRATLGYSMGGFGALVLPLKNPDVFTISVPLSISVRTDEQYTTEDASGWDDQWGRLFGGVGTIGKDRITEYYKQYSPFHIFAQPDIKRFKDLKLYIDNGDDEQTLCRSNEELHILLRDKNFPHEFRVRNGGHEFVYWREALPNALRFISDAFQGKNYRGDLKNLPQHAIDSRFSDDEITDRGAYSIWLPAEYKQSTRSYPVIYFSGRFTKAEKKSIAAKVGAEIETALFPPVLLVFLAEDEAHLVDKIIPDVEKNFRARNGYRFRALIGFESGGTNALQYALHPEMFTACSVFDAPVDCNQLKSAIGEKGKGPVARTWFYLCTTGKSTSYRSNGCAHILLRDEEIYHEYRVQDGNGGSAWFINNLAEALDFTQRKIHR